MKLISIFMIIFSLKSFADDFQTLNWNDLMPLGWTPPADNVESFNEFDSTKNLDQMQKIAPIVPNLDQKKVKTLGHILPLIHEVETLHEFILVPFEDACIHVPPPPENQMVYVTLKEPFSASDRWNPVWVKGVISTQTSQTDYSPVGYNIKGAVVEIHQQ